MKYPKNKLYTSEEINIALIKQRQDDIFKQSGLKEEIRDIKLDTNKIIDRFDKKMDEFGESIKDLAKEMKSNFHLLLGLILGIYGLIVAIALAKLSSTI